MILRSRNFKIFLYRLIMVGIIVLSGTIIGSYAYIKNVNTDFNVELAAIFPNFQDPLPEELILRSGNDEYILKRETTKEWLEPYTRNYNGQKSYRFSDKMAEYINVLAEEINSDPVNARFYFVGNKATEFSPAKKGKKLDPEKTFANLAKGFASGQKEIELAVELIEPDITLEKIGKLGITTLVASGESNFSGSSPSRIQNIKVSSSRYNGLIIAPGEEFSFNSNLDEINGENGYAYEKVIKDHKILYEYGGGICQVSTTLFRAAINAGLPIIERRPHSFPVVYYNPQGFDATIYPGITDLKFRNDTGGNILLQSRVEETKLIFEIYGSDSGRKVSVSEPIEYEKNPDGSLKAFFSRTIAYDDGETKEEKFYSSYKSPDLYPVERNPLE